MDSSNKKRPKYVIVSSKQHHGGSIVLHQLCKNLQELGYNAKMFHVEYWPLPNESKSLFWFRWFKSIVKSDIKELLAKLLENTKFIQVSDIKRYAYYPVRGYKRKIIPIISKDTIVVYPEIVYGNFLGAKKVVRWFLFHNRYKEYEDAYGADDLFFAYREVFNDKDLNPNGRVLALRTFDFEMYKQTNFGERKGVCYIIRKGKNRDDLPSHFDGPIIDDLSEKEIVEVFNKSKYCYSYDTQTFYTKIAIMCGCIPVVIPEKGKTRYDYLKGNEKGYGVAYGNSREEIDFAINTKEESINFIQNISTQNKNSVEYFLEECEKYFYR